MAKDVCENGHSNNAHWTWFCVNSEFGWKIPSHFPTKLAVYAKLSPM